MHIDQSILYIMIQEVLPPYLASYGCFISMDVNQFHTLCWGRLTYYTAEFWWMCVLKWNNSKLLVYKQLCNFQDMAECYYSKKWAPLGRIYHTISKTADQLYFQPWSILNVNTIIKGRWTNEYINSPHILTSLLPATLTQGSVMCHPQGCKSMLGVVILILVSPLHLTPGR